MAFIRTIPAAEAAGDVQAMYAKAVESSGYVPNYVSAFSPRPQIWNHYGPLITAIRGNMELRRYELVSVATALAIGSSYCSLAHGKVLCDQVLGPKQTEMFARDYRQAALTPAETVMVAFVRKLALQASTITEQDVGELRRHGFSDVEIFDIAAAATARCFFSKLLDALGVEPDHMYADMAPGLRQALTVGRDIETNLAA